MNDVPCAHKHLSHTLESSVVEYCPKGCDGAVLIDLVVRCDDCDEIIYEVHEGHEDCKYGRN